MVSEPFSKHTLKYVNNVHDTAMHDVKAWGHYIFMVHGRKRTLLLPTWLEVGIKKELILVHFPWLLTRV